MFLNIVILKFIKLINRNPKRNQNLMHIPCISFQFFDLYSVPVEILNDS